MQTNPNFVEAFESIFPLKKSIIEQIGKETRLKIRQEEASKAVGELYEQKTEELSEEIMSKIEREVYLQVLDVLWMQHLENMQHLREGIHWRGVGQRDPLVEYRSESQKLFDSLQATLRQEVLRAIMHVQRSDAKAREEEEDYDTELTRLAETAVETGVNEDTGGTKSRDKDFGNKKIQKNISKKTVARKKKKTARQNRKHKRK
jgi:preprotein translocase subunit SecA